jgi:DNA topoisomerase 2-associated protein PAT1
LDETDDVFNDDTFGLDEPAVASKKPVGKDFDFFGQTAKVSSAINEEQLRFSRQQPVARAPPATSAYSQPAPKPARSGYERYKEPQYVPDMQVDASLWGVAPKRPGPAIAAEAPAPAAQAGGRKMMSLEEVEAAMRAQAKKPAQTQPQVAPQQPYSAPPQPQYAQPPPQQYQANYPQHAQQYQGQVNEPLREEPRPAYAGQPTQPVQILQRSQQPPSQPTPQAPSHPTQILQNPNRSSAEQQRPAPAAHPGHQSRLSGSRHIITHPQQLSNLSEEERAAFLAEDAKRAKRNHKIFLLSKDNGLMTPQDKNFITRIQLQQLVTATGNPNEHGTDSALSEDFYYQVHNQIRGGPRQHPGQPLSNFAQTYLFQTGGRHGGMRRQARGGDNHMQRMEQQVQRAVEAAKNKPKNKQLVIEGSLGKISFSNAKTPKPLLNIKRETAADAQQAGGAARDRKAQQAGVSGSDRKTVLTDIENVYNTLMQMEDHDRHLPPPVHDEVNPELVGQHMDWREKAQKFNQQLWRQLKVHEPIGATAVHPFIAFLSFNKGKKAIPRVFRHITHEQRTTILTMIVIHLDQLDVVRNAQLLSGETLLTAGIRENVELFSLAVMPSLFAYLSEADLDIVTGVLGLILNINIDVIARTRIGVSMLTMILSRAELIKQAGSAKEQEWEQW